MNKSMKNKLAAVLMAGAMMGAAVIPASAASLPVEPGTLTRSAVNTASSMASSAVNNAKSAAQSAVDTAVSIPKKAAEKAVNTAKDGVDSAKKAVTAKRYEVARDVFYTVNSLQNR